MRALYFHNRIQESEFKGTDLNLGFEGVAPWRALAWNSFEAIREETSAADAVADLTRLRDMLEKHLTDLASGVPQ